MSACGINVQWRIYDPVPFLSTQVHTVLILIHHIWSKFDICTYKHSMYRVKHNTTNWNCEHQNNTWKHQLTAAVVENSLGMPECEVLQSQILHTRSRVGHTDHTHTPSFLSLDAPVNEEPNRWNKVLTLTVDNSLSMPLSETYAPDA